MKRRHCLYCGKRLRWCFGYKQFHTAEAARAFLDNEPLELRRLATVRDNSAVAALNPGHPSYVDGPMTVRYVNAEGDYGDNRFCTLRHGYRYAVQHTQEARPQ
jgi:hypothetical protein